MCFFFVCGGRLLVFLACDATWRRVPTAAGRFSGSGEVDTRGPYTQYSLSLFIHKKYTLSTHIEAMKYLSLSLYIYIYIKCIIYTQMYQNSPDLDLRALRRQMWSSMPELDFQRDLGIVLQGSVLSVV